MMGRFLNVILLLLLAAAMVAALLPGAAPLSVPDVLAALVGQGDVSAVTIVQDIRLPRVLVGVLVGAALGLSGATLQGLLRNPLADPGVIGVSTSAALGAVIVLFFGLAVHSPFILPLSAIFTALVAVLLLAVLGGRDASVLMLILAGVAISSFSAAMMSLVINLSPNPFALSDIVLWLMGSLSNRSMDDVCLALPFVLLGGGLMLRAGRGLDALTLGEDTAMTLGVDLPRLRLVSVVGVALAVGASVAVAGAVGFVGLVVPHILRPLVGYSPSRLLLPSALGGAILIVMADLIVRMMPAAQELKLGVVTALIGAPFFFHLLIKTRRSMR